MAITYTVSWTRTALNQLAAVWNRSADRASRDSRLALARTGGRPPPPSTGRIPWGVRCTNRVSPAAGDRVRGHRRRQEGTDSASGPRSEQVMSHVDHHYQPALLAQLAGKRPGRASRPHWRSGWPGANDVALAASGSVRIAGLFRGARLGPRPLDRIRARETPYAPVRPLRRTGWSVRTRVVHDATDSCSPPRTGRAEWRHERARDTRSPRSGKSSTRSTSATR